MRSYCREVFPVRVDGQQVGNVGGYIESLPRSHTLEVSTFERWDVPGSIIGKLTEKHATATITLEARAVRMRRVKTVREESYKG